MGGRETLLLFAMDDASSPLIWERCDDDGLNNLKDKCARGVDEHGDYLLLCNVIRSVFD
jgi:hypothetical protein